MDEKNDDNETAFLLQSSEEVVEFVNAQILEKEADDVDLVLVSTLFGFIEHWLAVDKSSLAEKRPDNANEKFPVVSSEDIVPLVNDFRKYIRKVTPKTTTSNDGVVCTDRQTIKDVATAVWKRLNKSLQKDKPHIQTLYTFKNGGALDCFGLAYAVVAGCQVLGCNDVHLRLSEDHAWIAFGLHGSQTAEVTWHGKQNEAYRGEPIDNGLVSAKNWLYMGGNPVICTSRRMEAAAAVAMINPSIDSKQSSECLSRLQQAIMWLLYDADCLSRYPMSLCILAELQENYPTPDRPISDDVYHQAIDCSRAVYGDTQVYPYADYGHYLHRQHRYSAALFRWQQAANVLRKYAYNKEEQELHKEIKTIAWDLIPECPKLIADPVSFFKNSENLTNLLLFYDGICEWEQNGTVAIFNNSWVKPFLQAVAPFPQDIRLAVLGVATIDDDHTSEPKVINAPLPQSPVKNIDAYHRSLVATVLNVYGNGSRKGCSETSKEGEQRVDEFMRICETTRLKADLVWNPAVVGPERADTPVTCQLQFRTPKMAALRNILTKGVVRKADLGLVLCAQVESTSGGNDGRRSERAKRQKIG